MSCLVWNCHGLGKPCTMNELASLVRAKDPSIVFITETCTDEARLKDVKRKIQFENMFIVPRANRGGGLVLFWKESVEISVEGSEKNHIDAIINKNKEHEWCFTRFYGEPDTHRRIESWDLLWILNRKFNIPWLCAGDFNELIRGDEKLGRNRRGHGQMQLFRDAIDVCGFMDLEYSSTKFTWSKHFSNGQSIWERLDRAFCTNEWLQQFAGSKVIHMSCTTLDHIPIWIVPSSIDPPPLSRPFRFEEVWLTEEGCGRTIESVWRTPCHSETGTMVMKKIEKCGSELTQLSRKKFGNIRLELNKKRKQLSKVEQVAIQTGVNF
nr:uncharacterized protein LOC112005243 [Quercus suber]